MGKIILVTGGNGRVVENYPPSKLALPASCPPSPFWLDLLSPSERLLSRISNAFKFDPRVTRACLSRYRQRRCEEFGDYLFIQTSLLKPSRKNLFIQRDIKMILSQEYLMTLHNSRTPLHGSLSSLQDSGFTHTGQLLLALFDESIAKLTSSFRSAGQNGGIPPIRNGEQPERNPLWWRLRNFRAALWRQVRFLREFECVGTRFFAPEDGSSVGSITAKSYLLLDAISVSLGRIDPDGENSRKDKKWGAGIGSVPVQVDKG